MGRSQNYIIIENKATETYNFKIYRKNAITNVQIKKNSCVDSKVTQGVFKGFLSRAWKICTEKYRQDEINFLIQVFVENGHDDDTSREYRPPELRIRDGLEENNHVSTEKS